MTSKRWVAGMLSIISATGLTVVAIGAVSEAASSAGTTTARTDLSALDVADRGASVPFVEHEAVLPRTHRLADRDSVTMADLDGEQFPNWPGEPPNGGPVVRDTGQIMQLIALGRIIAVLPESVRHHLRQDLVCVPVADGRTTTLAIAWPEDTRSRPLASFVRAATETATHER